jgi:hypothetical protein
MKKVVRKVSTCRTVARKVRTHLPRGPLPSGPHSSYTTWAAEELRRGVLFAATVLASVDAS